jgi:hypothetical protein
MVSKPPRSLIDNLKNKRCVLFVGAGLSKWANLPTWKELLNFLIDKMIEEEPNFLGRNELDNLLQSGKLLEVADYCKKVFNERLYNEVLSDRLRGDNVEIPEPHKLIVQLPFSAVVTTNYDKLLEQAYYRSDNVLPKTPTHIDTDMLGPLLFNKKFFILKAHGDIDRPDSLVLTTSDYREIIHSNPAFNAIFSAILLTNAILFIGYSISDPDFRLLLDRQLTTFKGNVPERYALMSGIGEIERDVLWRSARIRVIPYDDHNDLITFLQYLYNGMFIAS